MQCHDCEKFYKFGGDGSKGVCSLPVSFFPVDANADCVYMKQYVKTCKDCSHFKNDFACMTASEDDPADNCSGFEDKLEGELYDILFEWLRRGEYSRDKIEDMCDQFEKMKEYEFVRSHKQ